MSWETLLKRSLKGSLVGCFILLSSLLIVLPHDASAYQICIKDEVGERLHINVLPGGLLTGYSEFDGKINGTAIGSYKRISKKEVMMGGNVNVDCTTGFYPGSFNVTLNVHTLTGTANGYLYLCDGTFIPFVSEITPCDGKPVKKNWPWEEIEDSYFPDDQ